MSAVTDLKGHVDVETTFVFLSAFASSRLRVLRAAIPAPSFPLLALFYSTGTHEAAFALSRLLHHPDCPIHAQEDLCVHSFGSQFTSIFVLPCVMEGILS